METVALVGFVFSGPLCFSFSVFLFCFFLLCLWVEFCEWGKVQLKINLPPVSVIIQDFTQLRQSHVELTFLDVSGTHQRANPFVRNPSLGIIYFWVVCHAD